MITKIPVATTFTLASEPGDSKLRVGSDTVLLTLVHVTQVQEGQHLRSSSLTPCKQQQTG